MPTVDFEKRRLYEIRPEGAKVVSPGRSPWVAETANAESPERAKHEIRCRSFALSGLRWVGGMITQGCALGWRVVPLRGRQRTNDQ